MAQDFIVCNRSGFGVLKNFVFFFSLELLQVAANPIDGSSIPDSTLPQVCFKQLKFSFSYIRVTETCDIVLSHLCPSQVHACNILRALYRDTKLGEAVFPFVSDGVVVAIDGFLSESWAVSTFFFANGLHF